MSLCVRSKVAFLGSKSAPLSTATPRRKKSTALGTKGDNLVALRKGTGGRSSFNGIVATIFGATGFSGRYIVDALGKMGTMLVIPHRCDYYDARHLKTTADLGQIVLQPFDVMNEQNLAQVMQYSNVVINLIGTDNDTRTLSFKETHVDASRRIARIAREQGVEKFIHFSALNACEKPVRQTFRPSKFFATKWEGEQVVREEFPEAIIFRPSDMYGSRDRFLLYYASRLRRTANFIPVWGNGKNVKKCPVYVGDVADAVIKAILMQGNEGETYQAIGPRMYKQADLVDYIFESLRRGKDRGYMRYDLRLDPAFWARILFNQYIVKYPTLSFEKLEREATSDNVDDEMKKISDLGVKMTLFEVKGHHDLLYHRYNAAEDHEIWHHPNETTLAYETTD